MKLKHVLSDLYVEDLRFMARHLGLRLSLGAFKQDLAVALAEHLSQPRHIADIVAALSPGERQALDVLIAGGGRAMASLFAAEFGAIPDTVPYIYGSVESSYKPRTAAEGLHWFGLVYRQFTEIDDWRGEVYLIPEEILAMLPRASKPSFASLLVAAPPPVYSLLRGDVLRDIGVLLCYLKRETVRPVFVDRLAKRDLVKLNEELSLRQDAVAARNEADMPWIDFVHHLAALLGLVKAQSGLLTFTDKAETWLSQPRDRQIRDVWRAFQADGVWSEIEKGLKSQDLYYATLPSQRHVIVTRQHILDALKLCPIGQWITMASFSAAMKAHKPMFLRAEARRAEWETWSPVRFNGAWSRIEETVIFYTLHSTFTWLGLVDVGAQTKDGQSPIFRLTDQGAILLGLAGGAIADQPGSPIIIQPNLEIVVPAETSPALLFRLHDLATLKKRDRASIYALSKTSIWRYLQGGGNVDDIIAFLEQAAQRPLAQNLVYSLREWANKHGEVTIEPAVVLLASTEALMAELLANKKLALPVHRRLSPNAVTVRAKNIGGVIETLRKAGYWPKVEAALDAAQAVEPAQGGRASIKTSELLQLLAAATTLGHIAQQMGWTAPMSDAAIRNLTWRLAPPNVKQMDRLANEAIAAFDAHAEAAARNGKDE